MCPEKNAPRKRWFIRKERVSAKERALGRKDIKQERTPTKTFSISKKEQTRWKKGF